MLLSSAARLRSGQPSAGSSFALGGWRSMVLLLFAVLLAYSFSDWAAPYVLLACAAVAAAVWCGRSGGEDEVAPWLTTFGLLVAEQWMRRPNIDSLHM